MTRIKERIKPLALLMTEVGVWVILFYHERDIWARECNGDGGIDSATETGCASAAQAIEVIAHAWSHLPDDELIFV